MHSSPTTPRRKAPPRAAAPSRRRALAAVLTVGVLASAGTAAAASYVYFEGTYSPAEEHWSAEEPLTYSHGRSNDGRTICVDALYTNMTQVGSVACSSTTVAKGNYGGGTKRAYSRATNASGVDGRGRAEW